MKREEREEEASPASSKKTSSSHLFLPPVAVSKLYFKNCCSSEKTYRKKIEWHARPFALILQKKTRKLSGACCLPRFSAPPPSCQAQKQKVSRGGGNGSGQKVLPFSVNIKSFRPGAAERKRVPAWVRWRRRWCRCPGGREREEKSRPQSGAYSPKVLAIPIPEFCLAWGP